MAEENFLKKIQELSKDQISENGFSHEELWLIQVNLETHGPYHVEQLVKISAEYSDELAECMACNLKQKNWKPYFEHSPFQKRKSESARPVIKSEERGRHSYHLLIDGQKKGPLSINKINEALDKGELKMNSLVSADGGKSWRKLYHFPQFDRRKDVALDLEIQTPDEDHFEKSRIYSTQVLKKLNLKKNEESLEKALLSCQTHLHKKKLSSKASEISSGGREKMEDVFSKFSFNKKSLTNFSIAALVIVLVGLFLFDSEEKKIAEPRTTKSKTIKKETSRETAQETRNLNKERKRSKYSSRDRKRRRQDNLDNADLEYNENSRKYRERDRGVDREEEAIARRGSRRREEEVPEDDFIDNPEDAEEIAIDNGDVIDDTGRQIALDEGIDDPFEPADEASFEDGVEDLDFE